MSLKYEFRIDFGKSWKRYRTVLKSTAPVVLESCAGSDLEDKVTEFYESSLPQNRESPINFLLRNSANSYQTKSDYHNARLVVERITAKIGYYFSKIPLLRRVIRTERISTELYLGQDIGAKPMAYVSNQEITDGEGFGNDHLSTTISDFNRRSDFNIDVGFEDEGRNYFFIINADTDDKLEIARNIFQGFKAFFEINNVAYSETETDNATLIQLS